MSGMFYKVDSLAVDKDIALISQVLLDDGHRIIIPQHRGILNFSYFTVTVHGWNTWFIGLGILKY